VDENGDKTDRQRAFAKQSAEQIREPKSRTPRVGNFAAKQSRHHNIAHKPQDSAAKGPKSDRKRVNDDFFWNFFA
jgi:hypothetical protein